MAYAIDPETEAVIAALNERFADAEVPARGDWKALRAMGDLTMAFLDAQVPPSPHVDLTIHHVPTDDGATIELRWYTREGATPGPAVVYAHGGGMVIGSAEQYSSWVARYTELTGVPFLSVDYRRAPEVTGETPMRDTFTALRWLIDNATGLGVDPARIAVMGDSAGGGIVAGVTILAREHRVPIAHQILIYPMLDDRLEQLDNLEPFATWTYDQNHTGWLALLGDDLGGDDVSPVCAPARLADCTGLPPAYVEVGDLDIFREEDIAYVRQLSRAEVPVEFHLLPGAPHGFDRFAPTSALTERAFADRTRVLRNL